MSNIVSRIIDIEDGVAGPLETIETFGELVRTGAAHGLQGSWQRAIVEAMKGGLLTPDGDVTEEAYATFGDIENEEN